MPKSASLVGGTVRDALLDRHSEYLDLDFVLPSDAVETAQAIARHYRAGFVVLDAERQIARVVFPQGTADFALQVGETLEDDLRRRDFTVNAIAYHPHTKDLLDPLHGYEDLQQKRLRMVSVENLSEDPLRLLRAYRQAAQLGFSLESETQAAIRQLGSNLSRIAAERVQSELNYLLGTARGTSWIKTAWKDGVLHDWFPSATLPRLAQIAAIDHVTVHLQETWTEFWSELSRTVRGTPKASEAKGSVRTWVTIAKLASLLPDDPEAAEAQLWRLKYSRAEIQAVCTVLKALPQLKSRAAICDWSLAEQYQFFQSVGAVFPAIALLGFAIQLPVEGVAMLIDRFLDPADPVAHPSPILTGQDLISALQIPPSPKIGKLLAALQLARAEGKVSSREEAMELARLLI
ncbi:CCA tRNA nucleotidyltransferase [Leptolyngbya sp. FACHB-17]|uniref:CCA tRNA nucleotidyltransferase n=1 Tax=Leptolyngbya sp. FACHB-17 TaxID=2692803 RepID=UPI001F5522F2|nr:CCA tRNA nucleotidyltransferase [Leptolyngbya sp. FACHB-17]